MFITFQAVQVVIPILPGGLGCLAGVILFGVWKGFWYNYIGICAGSMAAFAIARACGRPLLESVFPAKMIEKYDRWMGSGSRFAKWFAFLIFIPVAPDDYLCFLAGTTRIGWRLYAAIILLCKPASIALYSLGLTRSCAKFAGSLEVNAMRTVHIYSGSLALVSKSGVGQAAKHQRAALESVGVHVVTDWDCRAEVVHINTVLPVSLWAARHARRRGQKVIWYGHSTEKDFRNSFTGSNLLAPLFKQWLRLCYNQADLIITPTPYSAKELAGYRLRPTIVPLSNGVDTRFFAPNPASRSILREKYRLAADKPVVISVGHYMQRKGILDFIALARKMPQVQFLWFGYTDPHLVPHNVKAAMADAPENLRFPGFLSQAELRTAYCGADAFLFCSYEETEGIVILEALACATPTLVRDIPAYRGWLRDSVNVHTYRTTQDLPTRLQALLQHKLPDTAAAARQTAEERALPRIGAQLLELYKTL